MIFIFWKDNKAVVKEASEIAPALDKELQNFVKWDFDTGAYKLLGLGVAEVGAEILNLNFQRTERSQNRHEDRMDDNRRNNWGL